MKLVKTLKLDFLPQSSDVGLLVLRVGLGLGMLVLHGWGKLINFGAKSESFPALIGTPELSLGLAVFAEVVCAALLVVGFLTRFAALNLVITMGVAWLVIHGGALSGENSGEMAFVYLAGYLMILLAGAGKFSVDAKTAS